MSYDIKLAIENQVKFLDGAVMRATQEHDNRTAEAREALKKLEALRELRDRAEESLEILRNCGIIT